MFHVKHVQCKQKIIHKMFTLCSHFHSLTMLYLYHQEGVNTKEVKQYEIYSIFRG